MNKRKIRAIAPIIIGILILSAIIPITSTAPPENPTTAPPPEDPPGDPPEPYYLPYVDSNNPYTNPDDLFIQFIGHTLSGTTGLKSYEWDFGDGSFPFSDSLIEHPFNEDKTRRAIQEGSIEPGYIECPANHTYPVPGFYTATFTVYDKNDESSSDDAFVMAGLPDWPSNWWTEFNPSYDGRLRRDNPDVNDPETSFEKKIWDANLEKWVETTSLILGQEVQFQISFTADRIMHDVVVEDHLPSTVEYIDASPSPHSVIKEVYTDVVNETYHAFTKLVWNFGDLSPGDTINIIISGIVKYLDKEYFEIPGEWPDYPIEHETKNIAVRTYTSEDYKCTNPHDYITKDNASFNILYCYPAIKLTKTVDPTLIHYGGTVNYTYLIENIGDVDLFNIELNDDKLGPITCPKTSLAVAESMTCEVKDVLITEDTENLAEVTGYDPTGYMVQDSDTANVVVINPDIKVVKTVDRNVIYSGEQVTWNITVENTGDTTLYYVVVEDTVYGTLASGITLAPGEKKYYEYDTNPTESTTNIVDVNGTDVLGLEVTNTSSVSVTVICFDINMRVDKKVKLDCSGDFEDRILAYVGDYVWFKIVVENTGNVLLDLRVCDVLPPGLQYANQATVNGTSWEPDGSLCWYIDDVEPSDTVTIKFKAFVVECGEHVNEVHVTGVYDQFEIEGSDIATVFALCPSISVDKTVDKPNVHEGDMVTYTYDVENTGFTNLYNVIVTDDQGLVPVYVSGDDGDNILQTTETWIYEATTMINNDVVNIGNVTAEDDMGLEVTDEDDASVVVIHPDIDVIKTVDPTLIYSGEQVTWNVTVENTGDTTLYYVVVEDTVYGTLASGITLAPGEKKYYEYDTNPTESTTNIVDVNGTDILGEEVTDSDEATVQIQCEDIDIEVIKLVKFNCGDHPYLDLVYAHMGDFVTFRILVTNTGDVPLNIDVCDELPDGLVYDDYAHVDDVRREPDIFIDPHHFCWQLEDVALDQTVKIEFRAIIDECGEHVNYVTVTGYYDKFEPVVDEDDGTVFVICPDISIDKTVDYEEVCNGELVTYTYEVTNTGNHHLQNVVVTDDKPGVNPVYISGDLNTDGWLDLGETWIYQATANPTEDVTNTGTVTAEDEMERQVSDEDKAFIHVIDCDQDLNLEINKTVKWDCGGDFENSVLAHVGDYVWFKIEIENIGDVPLDLRVCDVLQPGLQYANQATVNGTSWEPDGSLCWYIDDVEPGDFITIKFKAFVVECGEHVNEVCVTGTYEQEEIDDSDSATIDTLCPNIKLRKNADKTVISSGETVTYTYEVENTGDADLFSVILTDDQPGVVPTYVSGDNSDGILNPGEIWIYESSVAVYEDTTNIGNVTAEDEMGLEVTDEDDEFVDVEECGCTPEISVNKLIWNGEAWVDDLEVESCPVLVHFKILIESTGTCDLVDIVVEDILGCGLIKPECFSEELEYEIVEIDDIIHIFWTIEDAFAPSDDPIVITLSATAQTGTTSTVFVKANSTYDDAQVTSDDIVHITTYLPPENHEPYTPTDQNPGDNAKNIVLNPELTVFVEDPDGDLLDVCFFNSIDDSLIGVKTGVTSGTTASVTWSDLSYDSEYSWYAVADDGEFSTVSEIWTFTTISENGQSPEVKITKPTFRSLYFRNRRILPVLFNRVIIIGGINIEAEATAEDGEITKLEFYIDGELQTNDNEGPYNCIWNDKIFGKHEIKVIAYDNDDNTAEDKIDALIFNFGLTKDESLTNTC